MSDWKQVSDKDADRIRNAKPGHGHVYRDGELVAVSMAAAAQVIQGSMPGWIATLERRAGGQLESLSATVSDDMRSTYVEITVGGKTVGERFDLPDCVVH